jgi:SAM-dependent methyltransferase
MSESGKVLCPVCNSEASLSCLKKGYSIYRCHACGLKFVYPLPTSQELENIYNATYYQRGGKYLEADDTGSAEILENEKQRLSLVTKYVSQGRILDVGCALGGFLEVAREGGFEIAGTEISSFASEFASRRLQTEVFCGDLSCSRFPSEYFEAVTLWDVIEHLLDPVAALEEACRMTKKNGHIFISTGDAGSLWARMMRTHWPLLTPPQHLFFFTRSCLDIMMKKAGITLFDSFHPGKWIKAELVLLKIEESFNFAGFFKQVFRTLTLGKKAIYCNLSDIIVCVGKKQ